MYLMLLSMPIQRIQISFGYNYKTDKKDAKSNSTIATGWAKGKAKEVELGDKKGHIWDTRKVQGPIIIMRTHRADLYL